MEAGNTLCSATGSSGNGITAVDGRIIRKPEVSITTSDMLPGIGKNFHTLKFEEIE